MAPDPAVAHSAGSILPAVGLNNSGRRPYVLAMSTPRKSPKDTIKIRRLPKVGDEILIRAKVTRVAEPEGGHRGLVTYRAPGAPAPVTIDARYLDDDA